MNLAALSQLVVEIDRQRTARGFLSVEALLQLAAQGNTVLDPLSTLISASVKVGRGNLFYPQVVLEAHSGTLVLGDENCLYPQTFLFAEQGQLSVGHRNAFGEGGVTFKTSAAGEKLVVEDEGRYNQGATVLGTNRLGAGSQVLGSITVQECELGAGESYRHPEPDRRGGVLKGVGTARGVVVHRGEVMNGRISLKQDSIERQTVYHPKG